MILPDYLDCSEACRELAKDELEFFKVVNGCGSAQARFDFVPDTIYGLRISPACWVHDFDYLNGKTEADRLAADRRFLSNLLTIIELNSNFITRPLRRRRALKYYESVREFGEKAFWANK